MEHGPDSTEPRPLTDEQARTAEVLDEDFSTFEGRDAKQMLENEIAKAHQKRAAGDLHGAIVDLERAKHYGEMTAASLMKQARKESAELQKDALVKTAGELSYTMELLDRLLAEFKG